MTVEAIRRCAAVNQPFAQAFRYQYVIAPDRLELPGFYLFQLKDHWVHIGPALAHSVLRDAKGRIFGLCLGVAVDHNGGLPQEAFLADFDSSKAPSQAQFETYIARLAGRYACIVTLNGKTYFYCDPVGMIGAVYAPETRRIGASNLLCIDRPIIPHPLYDHEEIANGRGMFGLGHTNDAQVHRLNANHRMNLDTFTSTRFWPKEDQTFEVVPEDYGKNYDEMIATTRNIIARMTTLGPTSLPLSGGNDSRILMALTDAPTRSRIHQYFSHINTYANRRDSHIGAALCAAKHVPFEVHDKKRYKPHRHTTRAASLRYAIASGTSAAVPKEIQNGLYQKVLPDSIVMRGHQTNIMRGQYLTTADPKKWAEPARHIRIMQLVGPGKFGTDVTERFTPDFNRHYDDLPSNARVRASDFIFFETLVPAALGTLFLGQDHAFYLSPFNSRRLVQLSMQFDTAYRLTNAPTHDLLWRADPELAALPYVSELPADMIETDENLDTRKARIADSQARYKTIFQEPAANVPITPFVPTPLTD